MKYITKFNIILCMNGNMLNTFTKGMITINILLFQILLTPQNISLFQALFINKCQNLTNCTIPLKFDMVDLTVVLRKIPKGTCMQKIMPYYPITETQTLQSKIDLISLTSLYQ